MDISYRELIKTALADRTYVAIIVAIFATALITVLFLLFSVEARDIQIANRYSSFGETNYYRGRWYSLYGFGVLALAIAVGHSTLMLKFLGLDRRGFGILFGLMTILILVIGLVYAVNIIQQIAFI